MDFRAGSTANVFRLAGAVLANRTTNGPSNAARRPAPAAGQLTSAATGNDKVWQHMITSGDGGSAPTRVSITSFDE